MSWHMCQYFPFFLKMLEIFVKKSYFNNTCFSTKTDVRLMATPVFVKCTKRDKRVYIQEEIRYEKVGLQGLRLYL